MATALLAAYPARGVSFLAGRAGRSHPPLLREAGAFRHDLQQPRSAAHHRGLRVRSQHTVICEHATDRSPPD
jgi:hypothetical protein